MQQVKQGVSEALTQEEVPPAYRDAIQKYFDTMSKTPGTAGTPGTPVPAEAPAN